MTLSILNLPYPAAAAVPEAPTGTAAISGFNEATVTWNASSQAASYILYRGDAAGGPYQYVAQTRGVSFTDRGLSNTSTYYYVVTALNAEGQSPRSAETSIKPRADVLMAPVEVQVITGNGQVSLVWNAVTSAVGYNVYRSTSRGGPYTLLAAAPGPSYTDKGLTNGTKYYYVLQTKSTNTGAYSPEVEVLPSALLPAAPASVTMTPGSTWASLSWSVSSGATGYVVYRATSAGGPYSFAGQSNTDSFEDTSLANGTTYYYRIAAVNPNNGGALSDEVSGLISEAKKPRAAVISRIERAGSGNLNLFWDSPPGAVSFTVHRATSPGGPYTDFPPQTSTAYYDTDLTNGITYYYVVDTHNAGGVVRSKEASMSPVATMPTPGNVVVTAGNTETSVSWDPVAGASNYWVAVATSPGGDPVTSGYSYGLQYTATDLTNGQTYYFRVQSEGSGWSVASAAVGATPEVTLPLKPASVSVTPGNRQLSLTWTAVDGATGYKVYRKTESGAWPLSPVGTVAGTLFTDSGLTNGETYYYRVAAVNENGSGAFSYALYGTPSARAVPAPINVAVLPGNTQATVIFDPVAGATNYWVLMATTPGGPYIAGGYAQDLHYTVTGLTNDQTYYFRVQSAGGDWSAFSAEVSATPQAALPLAPANVSVTQGNGQLSVTWEAVDGATGYAVYRRTTEGSWPPLPVGTSSGTLFTDSGLRNGTKFLYTVAAINESGAGAWSYNNAGIPSARAIPAPVNVAALPGNTQATVTFDSVAGATNYWVTVAASPGGPSIAGGYAPDLHYTATGLTNGQTYYFRVQSAGGDWSAFSAEASAKPTPLVPPAMTGGTVVISGNTQISIAWEPVEGAGSYDIYRRLEGAPWPSTPVGTVVGTLFNDAGLVNGSQYHYAIVAQGIGGAGAWSSGEISGTPTSAAPLAPTDVTVIPGNTEATVSWSPVDGATYYNVIVAGTPGGPAILGSVYGIGTEGTSYVITRLTNYQTYYFRVQAHSAQGDSAFSGDTHAVPSLPANSGNITGRVSINVAGYSDLGVRNATVTLAERNFSVQTGPTGGFTLSNVPFGDYTMIITAPNMETQSIPISLTTTSLDVPVPQMKLSQLGGLKGDVNDDGRLGLEDMIYILQVLGVVRPEPAP